jgi:hypothetical protein
VLRIIKTTISIGSLDSADIYASAAELQSAMRLFDVAVGYATLSAQLPACYNSSEA